MRIVSLGNRCIRIVRLGPSRVVLHMNASSLTADFTAYLVVQMDALTGFANQLGHADEAGVWRQRADATLAAILEKPWDGERFHCISTVTGKPADPTDSVFNSLPILLGERLPAEVRQKWVEQIKRHTTTWGPATEHPNSPMYEPDGYRRGPIWAPSTMILIDGRRKATSATQDPSHPCCVASGLHLRSSGLLY